MLLIVSQRHDPHVDIVARELDMIGAPWRRFNTEEFPQNVKLELSVGASGLYGAVHFSDESIDLLDIEAVWYRRPEIPVISPSVVDEKAQQVAQAETRSLLRQLWAALFSRYWMSWPMNIRRADQKLLQLSLAADLGFTLPPTIITQDPSRARKFFTDMDGNVAVKTISGVILEGPPIRAVYTRKLCKEDLDALDSIAVCPLLIQRYIDKAVELRVTVVADKVFSAEMETQIDPKTSIDWRRGSPLRVPHRAVTLPDAIEHRCLALVRQLGLTFGCIDLIRTPSGEYVFLEINPNGQWAWIEGLTGFPIARKIAQTLASPPSADRSHGLNLADNPLPRFF